MGYVRSQHKSYISHKTRNILTDYVRLYHYLHLTRTDIHLTRTDVHLTRTDYVLLGRIYILLGRISRSGEMRGVEWARSRLPSVPNRRGALSSL